MSRLVVGVDGSPGSKVALHWAFEEAALRGAAIDAVHVWHYPYYGDVAGMSGYGFSAEQLAEAGREALDAALEEAGSPPDNVTIRPAIVEGAAAQALIEASRDADLLVVGSRGRGGFAGLVLGSVSQQCVQHAPCPVVVVPYTTAA